jgi:hypothetical protein
VHLPSLCVAHFQLAYSQTSGLQSCNIVSGTGFYPERLVDAPYIQRYTPVVEQRLAVAGARLAAILSAAFK